MIHMVEPVNRIAMDRNQAKLVGRTWRCCVMDGLFFGALFVYLWLAVDVRLIYAVATITNFPVFYKGWTFFLQTVAHPGGLVDYGSAFFSHLFSLAWAGAAVVTLQAWGLCAGTGYVLSSTRTPGARWLRFVPPTLVLATYVPYTYHFPATTAVLVSLLLSCLYIWMVSIVGAGPQGRPWRTRNASFRLAVFSGLSILAYAACGGAFWLFAAVCVLYESLAERRWYLAGAFALVAAGVSYVEGMLLFRVSALDAYTYLLPVSWEIKGWPTRQRMIAAVYALLLFVPVTIILWHLLLMPLYKVALLRSRSHDPSATPTKGRKGRGRRKRRLAAVGRLAAAPWLRYTAGALAVMATAGVCVFALRDDDRKAWLRVHYYACHEMWPEVLETARRHPTTHLPTAHAVDRALYHTGRLGDDLFTYYQHPDALLITGQDHFLPYWHKFDVLTDLGLMNLADRNLTECLETFGEHPLILKRLALVNLAKARVGAARICFGALAKTLFGADWARDGIARLPSDPGLTGDARVRHLRSVRLGRDYTAGFFSREKMLKALLESNRHNRMAFEYLMSWYLLTRQLEKFIENVERLKDFDYKELPRLYQEAMLVYAYGTKQPLPLAGHSLDPENRRRIEDFSRIFNRYGRDKRAAFGELAGRYGDSYFFYHIYGFSPVGI